MEDQSEGAISVNSYKNVLVCVTQQKTCERLIKKAATMKEKHSGQLYVLHVAKDEWNFLNNAKEGEALEYLFTISKSFGAAMTVLKSDNIVRTIIEYARENEVDCIVLGESHDDHKENRFSEELKETLKDVDVYEIPQVDF